MATADAALEEADQLGPAPVSDSPGAVEPLGKIWMKIRKERDLELHVRVGRILDTEYVALADYVPSTGQYEQQLLVDRRQLRAVLAELRRLYFYLGGRASASLP